MTGPFGHALLTAVEPASPALAGHEEQVVVDRDVALRGGADVGDDRLRSARIGDVPHLDAVIVALDGVVAGEGEVGVGGADELLGGWGGRQHAQVPDGLARVEHSGFEPDAGVGDGGIDAEAGGLGGLGDHGRPGVRGGRGSGRLRSGAGRGCCRRPCGAPVQGGRQGREGEQRGEARGTPGAAGVGDDVGHGAVLTLIEVALSAGFGVDYRGPSNSSSMSSILLISEPWSAWMSEASLKTKSSWAAPSVAKRSRTMVTAPLWCMIMYFRKRRSKSVPLAWRSSSSCSALSIPGM